MTTTGPNIGCDDVGDPRGRPALYLHGTPDSRLARPVDDGLVAAGVRLLAVDRPGYGGTPAMSPDDFERAVAGLLDALGVTAPVGLVAWSGGALEGLRLARSGWAGSLTIVAGLVPRDAYDDPDVRAAAPERLGLLEMASLFDTPEELAAEVAPMLAPHPCDHALALEHQREQRSPTDQAVLDALPGAADRMADGLVEAVRLGLDGVHADLVDQVTPFGPDALAAVDLPVRLWYGRDDTVTPPVFGHWYARSLPQAELTLVAGAGHYLPFTDWRAVLGTAPPG